MPFDALEPWDLSCVDWEDRLREGRSLIPDFPHLDLDRKTRAIDVFSRLRIPDVPGTPLLGDASGDWIKEFTGTLHGSIIGGRRMIPAAMLMIPKKNGKTTNAAAIALTEFILNERPNAEFLIVAATQAIANTGFRQAMGMINLNGYLGGRPGEPGRFRVRANIKTIEDRKNGSTLMIKTFSENVLTGVKPVFVLVDELHLLGNLDKAMEIIGQLRGGMMSQPEGLLIFITTQSFREPAGVFLEELTRAREVRDGIDTVTRMLPVLYELPDDIAIRDEDVEEGKEKWRDPNVWHMVTPNLGRSFQLADLIQGYREAEKKSAETVQAWASQHLNIQIGLALRSQGWNGQRFWLRGAAKEPLTMNYLRDNCDVIVGGIDGGGMDDLLGATFLGRETETRRWLAICKAWAHRDVLKLRESIAPRLRTFEKDGELVFVDDIEEAFVDVASDFGQIKEWGLLGPIGIDPAGVGTIVDHLADLGIEGADAILGISQGYQSQNQIKTTANKLAGKTLLHNDQPMMRWCVSNAKVEKRGNAIYVTKAASGVAKIDPLMSLFNAVAVMSRNPKGKKSIYEKRGPRAVSM